MTRKMHKRNLSAHQKKIRNFTVFFAVLVMVSTALLFWVINWLGNHRH